VEADKHGLTGVVKGGQVEQFWQGEVPRIDLKVPAGHGLQKLPLPVKPTLQEQLAKSQVDDKGQKLVCVAFWWHTVQFKQIPLDTVDL
jgi:hypothetical protein